MVRITKQNIRQHARGRGGTTGGVLGGLTRGKLLEKESIVSALAILGVGLLLVSYVLWTSSGDGNLRATADSSSHPNLHLTDKNAEQYNAIALDIIETLGCHSVLNQTGWIDGPMDAFAQSGGARADSLETRRLEESDVVPDEEEMPGAPNDDFEKKFEKGKVGGGGADASGESSGDTDIKGEKEEGEEKMREEIMNEEMMDDQLGRDGGGYDWKNPTARHLFCLAAFESHDQSETGKWKDSIKCDAQGKAQMPLLELWAMARPEMDADLLLKVLDMSVENYKSVVKRDMNLWSPRDDTGLDYMIAHVNEEAKTVDQGGLYGLEKNLGKGKVFVDVGSCLGTTSMAIALLYPGTKVVSIEVASPNWLLQEMNFRCNAEHFQGQMPLILLSGVGPAHQTSTFAKFTWQPDQVTTARSWTPKHEIKDADVVLSVKLRPWHSVLAEAEIPHEAKTNKAHVDVLNVDCGACEYNLIPSMTDDEFNSIQTVMGGVHWGYIPHSKLPSSKRGHETHERLCKHENFARTAKECCEFPNMEVISSYPGQVLVKGGSKAVIPPAGTISDVAGDLCSDYPAWALEKHVHDVTSDWGWFEIRANAKED